MWLINMTVIDDKLRNKETVLKRNLDVGHALFTELNQNTIVESWQDYTTYEVEGSTHLHLVIICWNSFIHNYTRRQKF